MKNEKVTSTDSQVIYTVVHVIDRRVIRVRLFNDHDSAHEFVDALKNSQDYSPENDLLEIFEKVMKVVQMENVDKVSEKLIYYSNL